MYVQCVWVISVSPGHGLEGGELGGGVPTFSPFDSHTTDSLSVASALCLSATN